MAEVKVDINFFLSRDVPTLTSLTGRCSRRSVTASLRHGLMGVAELGRYPS